MSEKPSRPEPIRFLGLQDYDLEQLTGSDQWVAWGYKWSKNRSEWFKMPYSPSGGPGSSSDSDTWGSYEEAVEYHEESEKTDGVGFVVSDQDVVVGIDLDGCHDPETEELEPWAEDIIETVDSYAEISPSGTGVRIFAIGLKPGDDCKEVMESTLGVAEEYDKTAEIEMYDSGRYLTMTGHHVEGTPESVEQRNDAIGEVYEEYMADDGGEEETDDSAPAGDPPELDLDDEEVLEKARNAANGDAFERLERGDDSSHGGDTSRADLAFCGHLAFWTGGDKRQMDRLFRSSGRMRGKWDEDRGAQTYGELTLDEALDGRTEFYDPSRGGNSVEDLKPDAIVEAEDESTGEDGQSTPESVADHPEEDGPDAIADDYWAYVNDLYTEDEWKEARYNAAKALEAETGWMYVLESGTLWVYDDEKGYYNAFGESKAAGLLESRIGANYSRSEKGEIIERLKDRNQARRKELNAETHHGDLVCVGNGVVDIKTGELYDHDPKYLFTRGVEHDWKPDAVPERTLRFLRSVTKRDEDMWTLLQQLGHGLMPGHPYKAFMVMFGPGDNGKSAVGNLFRELVGDDNAASVELRDFRDDSFATGDLPGKMINVGDDLSGKKLGDLSILKRLTGGDTLRSNEKYEKNFDFENEAAMFFSGNEPPVFAEKTAALKGRLYPIHMPYRFTQEDDEHPDADPRLIEKITNDPEEMSGLLSLAIQGAQELIETRGQFAMPEGPEERMRMYEAASDPIRRFVLDHLEQGGADDMVLKEDVYDVYTAMCRAENARSATENTFKAEITQQALIDVESGRTRKMTEGPDLSPCWTHLRFADAAVEYMSDRLRERYLGNGDGDSSDSSDDDGGGGEDGGERVDAGDYGGATPLGAITGDYIAPDTPTNPIVTLTVDAVAVKHLDGENSPAAAGMLSDETGDMKFVTFDADLAAQIEEGGTYRIQRAEVGEYQGDLQIAIDPMNAPTIETIERGVGATKGQDSPDGQKQITETEPTSLEAAADGGPAAAEDGDEDGESQDDSDSESTSDSDAPEQVVEHVVEYVRREGPEEFDAVVQAVEEARDSSASVVRDAIHEAKRTGKINRDPSGRFVN